MQYVFLIRSRTGCEKYVKRRSRVLRLVTYFSQSQPALERTKNTYCMGKRPFLYLYWVSLITLVFFTKLITSPKNIKIFF